MRLLIAGFSILLLAVSVSCGGRSSDIPLFFAAASLSDALIEAADEYEAETGKVVEFSFGGSTALANQVADLDAPAGGVIFAGQAPMELLVQSGDVSAGAVSVIARTDLVVVGDRGEDRLQSLADLASGSDRIAIADPDFAPAGQYAREALTTVGVWDGIGDRAIPTLDVRAALAAVSTGSVDFAVVYATDAMTEPDVEVLLQIDPDLHSPVVYTAAPRSGSKVADEAQDFIDFLASPTGSAILESYGFSKG